MHPAGLKILSRKKNPTGCSLFCTQYLRQNVSYPWTPGTCVQCQCSMQVLEFNGYSPERYPATHFQNESMHQKHTEKACDAQKKGETRTFGRIALPTPRQSWQHRAFFYATPTGVLDQTPVRLLMGRQSAAPMRHPATAHPITACSAVGCH